MSDTGKAVPLKHEMAKHESSKQKMAKEAKLQVKKRTDELLDDDEFDTDIELDSEALKLEAMEDDKIHTSARRKLEDYMEEKRLRRDIEDDFDI